MTFFQYFNMGGLGGGSKISWDGLEYRDIAAFTGPMQKKDVSVGDVGKKIVALMVLMTMLVVILIILVFPASPSVC